MEQLIAAAHTMHTYLAGVRTLTIAHNPSISPCTAVCCSLLRACVYDTDQRSKLDIAEAGGLLLLNFPPL